jgi:hypothetical protein
LTESGRRPGFAATAPRADDVSLRGLTCAVPFEDVWQAALALARGGLPGWSLTSSDDYDGRIVAVSRSLTGAEHDIVVRVTLDSDAQTRVDMSATARKPGMDFGRSARRIRKFVQALQKSLARSPRRGTTHGR